MKKRIITILCLTLVVLLIAACSATAPSYDGGSSADMAGPPNAGNSAPQATAAPGGMAGGYNESTAMMPRGESYLTIRENTNIQTAEESMITFSLKVDTASYANIQRYVQNGNLPPRDAVRVEEMVNYFAYEAPMTLADGPFAIYTEIGPSPYSEGKYLAFTRVKAKDIDKSELPRSNLTFLIDTSGSMDSYDKLPLLQSAFKLLVETLQENDKVSIVTYAGSSSVVLDSVSGADQRTILSALDGLMAGGSTAGADGIHTAYALAQKNFIPGGNNRVILATDGDFNVGVSDIDGLTRLISEKRDSGVYLSVLGFGTGNLQDSTMETLSKHGNGNYAYIHSLKEAEKVLIEELGSNLFVIANDVKAQVEFNPRSVKSYRLIGYENRALNNEDFADDTKDAGEIGVGTDVVILYELELQESVPAVARKYSDSQSIEIAPSDELLEVRIRYKNPGESESRLIAAPVTRQQIRSNNSADFRFAASVAAFGQFLRDSQYAQNLSLDRIMADAKAALGEDAKGYRLDFLLLLQQCKNLRR